MKDFLTEWLIKWGTEPVYWDDVWGSSLMWRENADIYDCIQFNPGPDTYTLTPKGLEYLRNV